MEGNEATRRGFLRNTAVLVGGSSLRISVPTLTALSQVACSARQEASPFKTLSVEESKEFKAIAARILPTTDTPGADEAGVIWFFDATFGTFNAGELESARSGLIKFQEMLGDTTLFSDLEISAQEAFLKTQELSEFFDLMRYLTINGFFGMSKYGGNKDNVGWKLIDVDPHQHAFQSPFGYYDAAFMKAQDDA